MVNLRHPPCKLGPISAPVSFSVNGGPATEQEAAAIAAAISRFQADTTLAAPAAEDTQSPWLRAAIVEGVSAKDSFGPGDPA